MDGCNGKAVSRFIEADFGICLHALSSELGLAEDERQRHREASGMRRADQLLGTGTRLTLEAAAQAVGIVPERAALGRDCAFAVLESALPHGRSMGFHLKHSPLWPCPWPLDHYSKHGHAELGLGRKRYFRREAFFGLSRTRASRSTLCLIALRTKSARGAIFASTTARRGSIFRQHYNGGGYDT